MLSYVTLPNATTTLASIGDYSTWINPIPFILMIAGILFGIYGIIFIAKKLLSAGKKIFK